MIYKCVPSQYGRRGFTLTEIAIVMAIVGIVIGGIWVAAHSASEAMRVQRTYDHILTIVSNIRAQEGGLNPRFTSAAQTDMTCRFEEMNIFPAELIVTTPCVTGNPNTYPTTEWGNHFTVYASTSAPDASATQFEVQMQPIPESACLAILNRLLGSAKDGGITYMYAGGTGGGWRNIIGATFATWPGCSDGNFSSDWKLAN